MSGTADQQEAEKQCRLIKAMTHWDMSFEITQHWQSYAPIAALRPQASATITQNRAT
jgi:hypothetical protein